MYRLMIIQTVKCIIFEWSPLVENSLKTKVMRLCVCVVFFAIFVALRILPKGANVRKNRLRTKETTSAGNICFKREFSIKGCFLYRKMSLEQPERKCSQHRIPSNCGVCCEIIAKHSSLCIRHFVLKSCKLFMAQRLFAASKQRKNNFHFLFLSLIATKLDCVI